MTVTEFSNEFDVLYNNISTNSAPNLDEYEKSVFLTKAQDEIVNNYFNPKGNKYQEGFDQNQKRQIDFLNLMQVKKISEDDSESLIKLDDRSSLFTFPSNILFVVNESINGVKNGVKKILNVVPLSYGEYSKLMEKPYKYPYKNQGWRLINNSNYNKSIEVIADPNIFITDYVVKYIKKPNPIILTNLSNDFSGEGLSIEGETTFQTCELDESIHQEILQRAVELAKSFYEGNINSIVELGKRSE